METMPPFQMTTGQRQLAAIMFTDAVSFSAQMNAQEVATLHRMERDTDVMTRVAGAHNGAVLKSTGDGLLISFGSAVEAVSCALEIQRGFAARQQPGADSGSLRHRIGIHLGDVFVKDGDVMGDGVNIAARIVNEAPPGGIVVSQMVHELVRNKLTLHVAALGARHLKNIRDPVPLFRLMLDPPPPPPSASRPGPSGPEPVAATPARRSGFWTASAVVALLAAGWFVFQAQRSHERDLAESRRKQAELMKSVEEAKRESAAPKVAPAADAFDYAAATTAVPANRRNPAESPARIADALRLSNATLIWLNEALRAHTKDRPLTVRGLGSADFTGATVFMNAQGDLMFAEGGASRARAWDELNDATKAALLAAAIDAAPLATPEEIRRGAMAFAYLRGRPELVAALRR